MGLICVNCWKILLCLFVCEVWKEAEGHVSIWMSVAFGGFCFHNIHEATICGVSDSMDFQLLQRNVDFI